MVKNSFAPGTKVWAKFIDHPYWPGRIASNEVTEILKDHKKFDGIGVLFFGIELTYALIPVENIVEFEPHIEKYNVVKESSFKKAMEMAQNNKNFEDPPLEIDHKLKKKPITKSKDDESEDNAKREKKEDIKKTTTEELKKTKEETVENNNNSAIAETYETKEIAEQAKGKTFDNNDIIASKSKKAKTDLKVSKDNHSNEINEDKTAEIKQLQENSTPKDSIKNSQDAEKITNSNEINKDLLDKSSSNENKEGLLAERNSINNASNEFRPNTEASQSKDGKSPKEVINPLSEQLESVDTVELDHASNHK